MHLLSDCRLYAFIDTAYLHGRDPATLARQLCEGGADLIQLRAKNAPLAEVEHLAQSVLPIAREAGVLFVLNDHPALAAKLGADLCHLGQEDFFGAGYHRTSDLEKVSAGVPIGLSTHSPQQARRALAAGPDYIAVGPVYTTSTKPDARPVTLEYVRWAAANITLPWFAIGGINLDNLEDVLAAGATRICVVSAILNAQNVAEACTAFKAKLTSKS
jgi:thiamine-phosphate pyrophosphorylase